MGGGVGWGGVGGGTGGGLEEEGQGRLGEYQGAFAGVCVSDVIDCLGVVDEWLESQWGLFSEEEEQK